MVSYLSVLGGLAMIGVGQAVVRERSSDAALRLTIGGALAIFPLLTRLVAVPELWMLVPLAEAGAAACGAWALFILADEVNPRQQGLTLPANISALRGTPHGMGLGGRIFYAVLILIAMAYAGQVGGAGASLAGAALAAIGVIVGGHFINQRGSWAVWILERHPEWVVWVYPSKLTVVNRRYGTTNVYHRAFLGLQSGVRVVLPAGSESGAAALCADVAKLCPGVSLGHTGELEAKFRQNPPAMRSGGAPNI